MVTTYIITLHLTTHHPPATIHDDLTDLLHDHYGPRATLENITHGDPIDPTMAYEHLTQALRSLKVLQPVTIADLKRRDWLDGYTGALAGLLARHEHRTATEVLDELNTLIQEPTP